MIELKRDGGKTIRAWVGTVPADPAAANTSEVWLHGRPDIEASALEQLYNVASLPFVHPQGIAVMPDVHFGIGATVGSVIPTVGAIIPAAVGVDIGCGMTAVRTSLKARHLPDTLREARLAIEAAVPVGFNFHPITDAGTLARYAPVNSAHTALQEIIGTDWDKQIRKASAQLGTLGGGNHFVELCVDEAQAVWIMLHSGSRGIGNMIGRHFIEKAKRRMEQHFITLPHRDLAYLPEDSEDFRNYVAAVDWAQGYAAANRNIMLGLVTGALSKTFATPFVYDLAVVDCHHNYISRESHFGLNAYVTRKGAIRAREGDLGIIPGSMGTRSYIVRGKGNAAAYHSCSHGAGRRMSRTAAGKLFTVEDLKDQTYGVECRKDEGVKDEIPGAYKDIDQVMAQQADLVEVVHTLKQVLCVKG